MSRDVTIRSATHADYAAIATLATSPEELFRVHPRGAFPWDTAQLERLAQERSDLTVLESGSRIIGFANLYHLTPPHHAFIGNVIIAKEYRGEGHGRRLLEQMVRRIFSHHHLNEARISVFAENAAALALYRSLGFIPYDEEQRTTPRGEVQRLIHMRLPRDE